MEEKPRDARESLFTPAFTWRLAWQGLMVGGLTLAAYLLGEHVLPSGGGAAANTMAFATLTLCQLFHAFDVRSEEASLLRLGVTSNPAMSKAFLIGLAMQLAVLLVLPLQTVFSTVSLSPRAWGVVAGLAVTPVVVCEAAKAFRRSHKPGKRVSAAKAAAGR